MVFAQDVRGELRKDGTTFTHLEGGSTRKRCLSSAKVAPNSFIGAFYQLLDPRHHFDVQARLRAHIMDTINEIHCSSKGLFHLFLPSTEPRLDGGVVFLLFSGSTSDSKGAQLNLGADSTNGMYSDSLLLVTLLTTDYNLIFLIAGWEDSAPRSWSQTCARHFL